MRNKIVAGNWKMNLSLTEGVKLAGEIHNYFQKNPSKRAEAVLCPPFIHLASISDILKSGKVLLGAQNCASEISGAFTGEVSCDMIKSTGADYVIIGHSERRTYYNEDDNLLNKKTALALKSGLKVIFCCGEVLKEREQNIFYEVVKRQMEVGLFSLTKEDLKRIVIAYEPVWAIGTGLTATPGQAQEMHSFIRNLVAGKYGKETADQTTILYGGSCKPSNAKELFAMPDVDGGLIGGASLKKEDFCAIVEAV
jgi:triosephosphate isomerase (TIM)